MTPPITHASANLGYLDPSTRSPMTHHASPTSIHQPTTPSHRHRRSISLPLSPPWWHLHATASITTTTIASTTPHHHRHPHPSITTTAIRHLHHHLHHPHLATTPATPALSPPPPSTAAIFHLRRPATLHHPHSPPPSVVTTSPPPAIRHPLASYCNILGQGCLMAQTTRFSNLELGAEC